MANQSCLAHFKNELNLLGMSNYKYGHKCLIHQKIFLKTLTSFNILSNNKSNSNNFDKIMSKIMLQNNFKTIFS
jgi:hypothetical protein